MNRLGYACVNMTLRKDGITTGRTCRKATWQSKGLDVLSTAAVQNVFDLQEILEWNVENGINFFRIGSDIIPWLDAYDIKQLKDYDVIVETLREIGQYVTDNDVRISFHPGQFCVLGSPNPDVVERTIRELDNHALVFDLMGLTPSFHNKINIHIGGAYGDKIGTMDRWIEGWHRLGESTKARLTIENDDKGSMYTVQDLMYVHNKIGIPIVFDYYHHSLHTGDLSEQDALQLAMSTWPDDIVPVAHYSECRRDELNRKMTLIMEQHNITDYTEWPSLVELKRELDKTKIQAHSDYLVKNINTYGNEVDVMIEAKAKELALLKYRERELLTDGLEITKTC